MVCFPLQKLENKTQLKTQEKIWMHSRRGHLINDEFTWCRQPKLWNERDQKYNKPKKQDLRPHQIERVRKREELREKARKQAKLVFNTDRWRKWGTETLMRFFNTIKMAHLRLYQWNYLNKVVKAELYK